jgi:hypothetical protein
MNGGYKKIIYAIYVLNVIANLPLIFNSQLLLSAGNVRVVKIKVVNKFPRFN